jgi:P-type Cu+ transporter
VTVGLVNAQYVAIKSGLHEGEQVIYDGYQSLREGDPVVPTAWGPQGPLTLPPATGEEKAGAGTVYTCRMHPEVRLDHPGNCPKCGMKLVPVKAGAQASRPSGALAHPSDPSDPSDQSARTPEHLNARAPDKGGSR